MVALAMTALKGFSSSEDVLIPAKPQEATSSSRDQSQRATFDGLVAWDRLDDDQASRAIIRLHGIDYQDSRCEHLTSEFIPLFLTESD